MTEPLPVLNACGFNHDMAIIASQPLPEGAAPLPHTVALYRCRKCGIHMALLHVGVWQFADFHLAEMEALKGMTA